MVTSGVFLRNREKSWVITSWRHCQGAIAISSPGKRHYLVPRSVSSRFLDTYWLYLYSGDSTHQNAYSRSESTGGRTQKSKLHWRLHRFMMDRQAARYAPMNQAHIPSFPNPIPKVDWLTHLPKFKDQEGDDAAFHLIKFHMHISRLRVQFP